MPKKAAVDAIGRLEQDRRIDKRVEDCLACHFVRGKASSGFRHRQLQLGNREELAFDAHQEILDPPAAC